MAAQERSAGSEVPPVGEQLHLPGPSYHPAILAFGGTLALVGVVVSIYMLVLGLVLTLVSFVLWVREAREEMSELPVER